jgi:hypothetical protein
MIWFKFCLEYTTACLSCMMCLNFEVRVRGLNNREMEVLFILTGSWILYAVSSCKLLSLCHDELKENTEK